MLKILSPHALPFDYQEWKELPFGQRLKMLCQAWALQGYGAPVAVYSFYLIKVAAYVGLWIFFCSFSSNLGSLSEIGSWWFAPEALLKAVLWSMLFEGMGLGSGSGPLTARYFPPIGGIFYFLRPGTIKLPLFPGSPLFGGDKRRWVDVLLYLVHIGVVVRALISPEVNFELLLPAIFLLPILGLSDRTIFLSARAEHYYIALICFLFPGDALSGAKLVWLAIWFWAATSKLNKHFPSVIAVMISNSAVLRIPWLRKRFYKSFPEDLRPGRLAVFMAHAGTVVEYTFPLLLIFGEGGMLTTIGLAVMLVFHLFITLNVPMAVPIEWNVIMVYGAFVLFGPHANVWLFDLSSPLLIVALTIALLVVPVVGNLVPRWVSFLMAMRYYAGNWAYSIWLFRDDAEEKLDDHLIKTSPTVMKQLAMFYDKETADILVAKVAAFRSMHLHGRVLQKLLPKAVDNMDNYAWRDGELIAGVVLGWNFGDGHLHNEQLLRAIQARCHYESGDLRCIFVQAQPFGKPYLDWRIVDAHDGLLEQGRASVAELTQLQPWGE